jgi:hypothetical protein
MNNTGGASMTRPPLFSFDPQASGRRVSGSREEDCDYERRPTRQSCPLPPDSLLPDAWGSTKQSGGAESAPAVLIRTP